MFVEVLISILREFVEFFLTQIDIDLFFVLLRLIRLKDLLLRTGLVPTLSQFRVCADESLRVQYLSL